MAMRPHGENVEIARAGICFKRLADSAPSDIFLLQDNLNATAGKMPGELGAGSRVSIVFSWVTVT